MTQIQVKCVLSRNIPIYKYDPYIPNETATSTPPDKKFLQSLTTVQTSKTWSHRNPRCTIRKSPNFFFLTFSRFFQLHETLEWAEYANLAELA